MVTAEFGETPDWVRPVCVMTCARPPTDYVNSGWRIVVDLGEAFQRCLFPGEELREGKVEVVLVIVISFLLSRPI